MFILWALISLVAGFIFTEMVGYFLHKLLHSEKVPYLSRSHMIHHLKKYGPKMPMRSSEYLKSVSNRTSIGSIGLEWLLPIAIIFFPAVSILLLLGVPFTYLSIGLVSAIGWGIIGFNYMHDAMHIRDFWMLKHPCFSRWFKNTRRLHDVHHVKVSPEGRMEVNYGMCFFWFDKLFGTFAPKIGKFDEEGFEAAKERYSFIHGQDE